MKENPKRKWLGRKRKYGCIKKAKKRATRKASRRCRPPRRHCRRRKSRLLLLKRKIRLHVKRALRAAILDMQTHTQAELAKLRQLLAAHSRMQGLPGQQVMQGIPGPRGEYEADGTDGLPGMQGPRGERGADGADGLPGMQGPQGERGADGADGLPGMQGPQGERGADGDDGLPGMQGPRGEQGVQGQPGIPGAPGQQGDPGPQGLPGMQGEEGPPGPQGPPGPAIIPVVTVLPTANRYFYEPEEDLDLSSSAAIPAGHFTNDAGTPVAGFALGPNSFNNLYINGIVQPGNSYDVNEPTLFFPPQDVTIYAGTPIVLETVQLTASVTI